MNYTADIKIYENIDNVYKSIMLESGKMDRSEQKIIKNKDHIEIKITATDANALRASFNSIMKLLSVFEKMETIGGKNE